MCVKRKIEIHILRLRPCRRPPLWLQPEVSEGFEDMQGLQQFNLIDPSKCCPASPQPANGSSNKTAPDNFGVDPRIRVTRWPFSVIWVSLGSILVIKLSKDAHRGALEGPRIDFSWFLMDFGSPSGDHFGLLFHIVCDLKCTKACLDCMHEFWWILIGKSCEFWCSNLSEV